MISRAQVVIFYRGKNSTFVTYNVHVCKAYLLHLLLPNEIKFSFTFLIERQSFRNIVYFLDLHVGGHVILKLSLAQNAFYGDFLGR